MTNLKQGTFRFRLRDPSASSDESFVSVDLRGPDWRRSDAGCSGNPTLRGHWRTATNFLFVGICYETMRSCTLSAARTYRSGRRATTVWVSDEHRVPFPPGLSAWFLSSKPFSCATNCLQQQPSLHFCRTSITKSWWQKMSFCNLSGNMIISE